MEQKQIDRINELAKKAKSPEGLTEWEEMERAALRREYIDSVLGNLKGQLDNTYIVDEQGNKIKADWREKVTEEDVVLVAGDISWAMKMDGAMSDLYALASLPGKKVFIRGNHDYWWNGITRLRERAPDESFVFLQTDAVRIGDFVICGSRGWTCPGSPDYTERDERRKIRRAPCP